MPVEPCVPKRCKKKCVPLAGKLYGQAAGLIEVYRRVKEWGSGGSTHDVRNALKGAYAKGLLEKAEELKEWVHRKGAKSHSKMWEVILDYYFKDVKVYHAANAIFVEKGDGHQWIPTFVVDNRFMGPFEREREVTGAKSFLETLKKAGGSESILWEAMKDALEEINCVAHKRDRIFGEVEKRIVSPLLTLMNGLRSQIHVIVIEVTTRLGNINPTLRRFGQFDIEKYHGLTYEFEALEVGCTHIKNMKFFAVLSLGRIVKGPKAVLLLVKTHGEVSSDFAILCKEVALQCIGKRTMGIDVEVVEESQAEI